MKFSSTFCLYFSLADLMARLTSLLTSNFSDSVPVKNTHFFVEDVFELLGNPGFIVGEDSDSF